MNTPHTSTAPVKPSRLDAALGLLATLLLAGIVGIVWNTAAFEPPQARAETSGGMVAQVGEYELLTADVGNENALFVIDQRTEELCIYRTDQVQGVQLLQRMNLPRLFLDARAKSQGRTNP